MGLILAGYERGVTERAKGSAGSDGMLRLDSEEARLLPRESCAQRGLLRVRIAEGYGVEGEGTVTLVIPKREASDPGLGGKRQAGADPAGPFPPAIDSGRARGVRR